MAPTLSPAAVLTPERAWVYPESDGPLAGALARDARISPLLARLLLRRGVATPDAAAAFLDPALTQLHDPSLLPNIAPALDRISAAIAAHEPILLYADYDVDGTTGAAILYDVLTRLGGTVLVHVPDRVKDGYGLKVERLKRAREEEGARVVISIDNGVAALDEARFCREIGLDLIVTDHHTMKSELPDALAVIHPRVPSSRYPNPHICGAGVAFKLAWAAAQRMSSPRAGVGPGSGAAAGTKLPAELRERLLCALGLVALGTIADVVALKDENRAFVRHGLKVLGLGPTPGIRALLSVCDEDQEKPKRLDSTHVAFQVAPRLNAAGRMGDARRAFELLTAPTDDRAHALAAELDRENARRRGVQKETLASARAEIERVYGKNSGLAADAAGIVIAGADWPLGVVGIVAAKLVEEFHRPVLVLTAQADAKAGPALLFKGSGRSVPEVDLLRCLERCREHLETFGGHAAACGLSLTRERIDAFRAAWSAAVAAERGSLDASPHEASAPLDGVAPPLVIDLEVALADVSPNLLHELDLLEPYGQGNRPPLLAARGLELAGEPRPMGRDGDHCSFFVRQGESVLRTVAFGRRDLLEVLRSRARDRRGGRFELAFRPKLNRWNGTTSVELECEELRFRE
jgi:single-stranded-DNA-specific exonuclease